MINKYIEHTLLKPGASGAEIEKLANDAVNHDFFGVCVNPNYVKAVKKILTGSEVKLVTVVNFPLSNCLIDTILFQTELALNNGADEIDTVLNLSAFKNKDYKKVVSDIEKTKQICSEHNLKVILETDILDKEEIETACKCAIEGRANFVKTSTGFIKGGIGAKEEDVELMYKTVNPYGLFVKASGGIKDYNKAKTLIEKGAKRLGTSSGVEIVLEERQIIK